VRAHPARLADRVLRLPVTDTCWLRLLEESDADELSALVHANRGHLRPWMAWAADQTRDSTLEFIRMTRGQVPANEGLQLGLVYAGAVIGVAGFNSVDWRNRAAELGYWLARAHQGRGTMTRTVRVLLDHAFGTWQLNRVEIRAATENLRSRAIPERLGFRAEGTLRGAELVGGRYLDNVVYAMLAADWEPAA
jgi:ribosomal-protein-serine acetyltransferase